MEADPRSKILTKLTRWSALAFSFGFPRADNADGRRLHRLKRRGLYSPMINALALNLIADVMAWDMEEATKDYAWLRLMSSVKYDGYSEFRAGARFLESLASWLCQLQPGDRSAAYGFVKTRLIYLSQVEMQRVIELFNPGDLFSRRRAASTQDRGSAHGSDVAV